MRRWRSWLSCDARSSRMESIAQMSPHSASFHLRGSGRVALSGKIRFLSDHLADGPKGGPLPPIRKREPHHCNIMTDAEFSCPVLVISMDDAVERRAAFFASAERAVIPWRFVEDCSDLDDGLRYYAPAVAQSGKASVREPVG